MERPEAVARLKKLEGADLRPMADEYSVTVWSGDKKNKGWAGHVLERYLGLPISSAQSPNFGSWELKIVPLKRNSSGALQVKETMAITMIDPYNVQNTPFERSHLLSKLQKVVIRGRVFESQQEQRSVLVRVAAFDLDNPTHFQQVKQDYELVRETIRTRGFEALTGAMGVPVQPRTKWPGHGSTSRASYARTGFVTRILGLSSSENDL